MISQFVFELPYLLIELFYIGTCGAGGRLSGGCTVK